MIDAREFHEIWPLATARKATLGGAHVRTMRCSTCGEPTAASPCPRCGGRLLAPNLMLAPRSASPVADFIAGIQSFLSGIRFGVEQRTLLPWVIAPVGFSIVLFLAIGWGCWELLHPLPERWLVGAWPSATHWLQRVLRLVLDLLLYPLILVIALIATYLLASVITAPVCDVLVSKTEALILGPAPPRHRSWWRALVEDVYLPVTQALKLALVQTLASLALFGVSLFSAGLASPLVFISAIYFAALLINDFPLSRKRYRTREKIAYQNAHLAHYMGFGLLAHALPFLLPFAVIGATRSYLALRPK